MICNCSHLLFSQSIKKDWRDTWHSPRGTKMRMSLGGKFKESEHLENVGVNGIILNES